MKQVLAANNDGFPRLQARLSCGVPKFGNDHNDSDRFAREIVKLNTRVLEELDVRDYRGGRIEPGSGISTAWRAGH